RAPVQRHEGLRCGCGEPARDVPEEEAHLPERVLDVVAEHPEEEHVEDDVLPATVHEHGGEGVLVPGDLSLQGRSETRAIDLARVVAVMDHVSLDRRAREDRKSTRLNSSHEWISYAVFCLKKKTKND